MWNIRKRISKGEYDYALVPEHPKATKLGYVFMHRIVMENHIGRLLNDNEVVHHKDENKKNNNIDNLQLMTNKEHVRYHVLKRGKKMLELKCPWCKRLFTKDERSTHLHKKNVLNCSCCSPSCRGKLSRYIQLHGITHEVESAISENIVRRFKVNLLDNSEETIDIWDP